ncbi:MAG: hypothetical protein M1834_004933 [Cirrosporium novae-zelandiae]|nr:MAG: hypothetical protein M1834_004933 [Cirrosporium novae-zelandiae]
MATSVLSLTPFVPYHTSAGRAKIVKFGGLITTEFLEPSPGRSYLLRQTYKHKLDGPVPESLRRLFDSPKRPRGPGLHFHQYQTEYFHVESGLMGIEVDGVMHKIGVEDGEILIKPGSVHRFFIHPDSTEDLVVYLSASDSGKDYQLDRTFLENFYGYWHDATLYYGGPNWIQALAILDSGDSYVAPPSWVPFRRTLGYWGCVVLGRWVGGILNYKPFFREYTTDWDYAMAKISGSYFQRHMIETAYASAQPWEGQMAMHIENGNSMNGSRLLTTKEDQQKVISNEVYIDILD